VVLRKCDRLRWKRPANNPIRESYLEMIAALDASNRLVTDLWGKSGTSVNVDLLFGFAARAFHSHHDVAFVGHWRVVPMWPI
jgi:hypothetical protein